MESRENQEARKGPTREEMEREIKQNYEAFTQMEFDLRDTNKFALLSRKKLLDVLDTRNDAHEIGKVLCKDGVYSVQEIVFRIMNFNSMESNENQEARKGPTREEMEREIKQNYEAFAQMEFKPEDTNKFALLSRKKLLCILDTRADAHKLGKILCKDEVYSMQEINPPKIELGSIPYALRTN